MSRVIVSDDSDAEIVLPLFRHSSGPCWSCQRILSASELPIRLDSDVLLPVCPECWGSISVSDRVSLCIQFMDRWQANGDSWRAALDVDIHGIRGRECTD